MSEDNLEVTHPEQGVVTPGLKISLPTTRSQPKVLIKVLLLSILILITLIGYGYYQTTPPKDFPVDTPVEIKSGMGVKAIARTLEEQRVIRSRLAFYLLFLKYYQPADLKASTYIFTAPLSLFAVADRLAEGDFTSNLITLTHREGESVHKLSERLVELFPDFDTETFLREAYPLEGYLFPDTYHLPNDITPETLIKITTDKFASVWQELDYSTADTELSKEQVVILASILEREANNEESMRMVSGILQNRLRINMPLQVDASMEYELDKELKHLTPEDLKLDSPYNTYKNYGLPPTPIGNPGLTALRAVLHPLPSDYFYYITDDTGKFHYAKDFDQHRINISRYLR